jgi:hypothetical protein
MGLKQFQPVVPAVSEMGHLQTFGEPKRMSALPRKADNTVTLRQVSFGPEAVIGVASY